MAEISLDFELKSPIHKVWKALTDSDMLAKWVMENNFQPVVGHKCQFRDESINLVVECEVLEVDEPHKLSYTWIGGPLNTVVTWTLKEEGDTTYLHLDHSGFEQEDYAYQGAKYGWSDKVKQMTAMVETA